MDEPAPNQMSGLERVRLLCLLVSLLLLWVQDSDGRSVKIGEGSLYHIEKIETINGRVVDHTVPGNGSSIERIVGGGFDTVLDGRAEKFEGEIFSSKISVEEPRVTSVQDFKYGETEENETEQSETEQTKEYEMESSKEKETEEIVKPQQIETEEAKETEVDENGGTEQNEIEETEKVEVEDNMEEEIKESEKKEELESEQSEMKESKQVNMEENERKLESGEKGTLRNQLKEWTKEMEEKQEDKREGADTKNLEKAEEKTKVKSNEEDVEVITDKKTNVTKGKEIENFEEELDKADGEIMDSLPSNEKKDGGFSVDAKLTELTDCC